MASETLEGDLWGLRNSRRIRGCAFRRNAFSESKCLVAAWLSGRVKDRHERQGDRKANDGAHGLCSSEPMKVPQKLNPVLCLC